MTFHSTTLVRSSRKPHRCEYCGCQIPAGSPVVRVAGKHDGDFYTASGHEDCKRLWDAAYPIYAEYGEGMAFNLYEAICGDECREIALGELNHWRGQFPHVICRIELGLQQCDQREIERQRAAGFEPDLEPWEALHS